MAAPPTAAEPVSAPAGACGFDRRLASGERDVRVALIDAMTWMRTRKLCDDDLSTVEIVLAEALNNVVEHAYRATADGWIQLRIAERRGQVTISITDGGAAMPDGALPRTALPAQHGDRAALPEGGFGWALIRHLATDLCYRREDGRNRLSITLSCKRRDA